MNETQELEKQSESLVVQAQACRAIATTEEYTQTIELGRSLKAMLSGIEDYWKPLIEAAHRQHKALISRRDAMTKPVDSAIARLKGFVVYYDLEEERKRQEAERIAAEALRKQQEADAMLEAERLAAAGDKLGAEQVIEQAVNAPPPPVIMQSTIPQVAGKSTREVWRFRVIDDSKIPREYLTVDEIKIGAVVRALKGKTKIPGIEVYPESVVAFRT
jgi:hypothetical protein